jgi:hypothetical protein
MLQPLDFELVVSAISAKELSDCTGELKLCADAVASIFDQVFIAHLEVLSLLTWYK